MMSGGDCNIPIAFLKSIWHNNFSANALLIFLNCCENENKYTEQQSILSLFAFFIKFIKFNSTCKTLY